MSTLVDDAELSDEIREKTRNHLPCNGTRGTSLSDRSRRLPP
jgi:hypothetical protein